jgi:16S rRNA processing protein RimM
MSSPEIVEGWTVLAHILRPQGRKGEVLAELLSDFPDRFDTQPAVHLGRAGVDETHRLLQTATIKQHWMPVGRNHGRVVLAFVGVDTIEAAELLAGLDIIVAPEARVELAEDEEYISDLVGCAVFAGGTLLGHVTGVEFATSPDGARRLADAAPLLTLSDEKGEEILIPYVQQFIVSLSVEQQRIDMQLPEGLVDLNRRPTDTTRSDSDE